MLLIEVEVKDTNGKGLGLFTTKFIQKGTIVYKDSDMSQIWSDEKVKSLPQIKREWWDKYATYKAIEKQWYLCTDDARFWNHSNNPNCRYIGDEMIAIEDILQGEELTSDYKEFCDECKNGNFNFDIAPE